MTVEKRIRLPTVAFIVITVAEILMALLDLLTGSTVAHVALVYGSQLLLLDGFILYSRSRLKRGLNP